MSGRPRWGHSPAATANVALAAIKGEKTLAKLAEQVDVLADQIASWRMQLPEGADEVLGGDSKIEAPRTH
jgi:transposase